MNKKEKTRIFIIGFNKTATRTIHYFFKNNGLPCLHWDNNYLVNHFEENLKKNLPLLGPQKVFNTKVNSNCTYQEIIVVSDMTNPALNKDAKDYYKILDKQYPGSKFILNYRNVNSWINSRIEHPGFAEKQLEYHNCSSLDKLKEIWEIMYFSHIHDCEKYFDGREIDFLKFNIDLDQPTKICNFLKDCYPHLQVKYWEFKGKTGDKKIIKNFKSKLKKKIKNLLILLRLI